MARITYRSIFLSDVHLGTRDTQAEQLLDFLRHTECQYLYLVGDIIDFWKGKSGWYWPVINNNIVQIVLDKARRGTRVVYIPGNHDELLRDYAGTLFNGVEIRCDDIHVTADKMRLLVLHGDEFDSAVKHNRLLLHIGTWAYDLLLWLNRKYNFVRRKLGLSYWSLAGFIKRHVKNAVRYVESFEQAVAHEARRQHVDGLVCGHIHKAEVKKIGNVLYANSGDWVEHCSALVEEANGSLRVVYWADESLALLEAAESYENCDRDGCVASAN